MQITGSGTVAIVTHGDTQRVNLVAGDKVTLRGCSPSALNAEWTVTGSPTRTEFRFTSGSSLSDGSYSTVCEGYGELPLRRHVHGGGFGKGKCAFGVAAHLAWPEGDSAWAASQYSLNGEWRVLGHPAPTGTTFSFVPASGASAGRWHIYEPFTVDAAVSAPAAGGRQVDSFQAVSHFISGQALDIALAEGLRAEPSP